MYMKSATCDFSTSTVCRCCDVCAVACKCGNFVNLVTFIEMEVISLHMHAKIHCQVAHLKHS